LSSRPSSGAGNLKGLSWDELVREVRAAFKQGETDMGDKGKRDKGKREQQKKAQRTPQEKRKAKQDKKNQSPG